MRKTRRRTLTEPRRSLDFALTHLNKAIVETLDRDADEALMAIARYDGSKEVTWGEDEPLAAARLLPRADCRSSHSRRPVVVAGTGTTSAKWNLTEAYIIYTTLA